MNIIKWEVKKRAVQLRWIVLPFLAVIGILLLLPVPASGELEYGASLTTALSSISMVVTVGASSIFISFFVSECPFRERCGHGDVGCDVVKPPFVIQEHLRPAVIRRALVDAPPAVYHLGGDAVAPQRGVEDGRQTEANALAALPCLIEIWAVVVFELHVRCQFVIIIEAEFYVCLHYADQFGGGQITDAEPLQPLAALRLGCPVHVHGGLQKRDKRVMEPHRLFGVLYEPVARALYALI